MSGLVAGMSLVPPHADAVFVDLSTLTRQQQENRMMRQAFVRAARVRGFEPAAAQQLWEVSQPAAHLSYEATSKPAQPSPSPPDPGTQSVEPERQPLAQLERTKMAIFTCMRCRTRSAKVFSADSYDRGIVIVQCPGCEGRHLLADRLGWFGEHQEGVEEFLAQKGETVRTRTTEDGTLELHAEDLMGLKTARQLGMEGYKLQPKGQSSTQANLSSSS